MSLFDKQLLVVVGKGGVGRTTATCALALAAARRGKRVCLVEFAGMQDCAALFGGRRGTYEPQEVAKGVMHRTFTPIDTIEDFGKRKLGVSRLIRMVLRSRIVSAFLEAVPGLHDLLQLGKLENMISDPLPGDAAYDLTILDAPATGHGLTLLAAAKTMQEVTGAGGQFNELSGIIEVFLRDAEKTGVVLVTLPEELPVNESLELVEAMRDLWPDAEKQLGAAVVNQVQAEQLPETPPWDAVRPSLTSRGLGPVVEVVDRAVALQTTQHAAIDLLHKGLHDVPVLTLPRIPRPIDVDALRTLAEGL